MAKETKEEYIQQRIIQLETEIKKTQEESDNYQNLYRVALCEYKIWKDLFEKEESDKESIQQRFIDLSDSLTRKSFLGFVYYRIKQ